jgi:photosystem II stability/assembly factor-like uncharacterized protein
MGGRVLAGGQVVIVGLAGALLLSTDQGRSFRLTTQADRQALSTVLSLNGDRILAFGERGISHLPLPAQASAGEPGGRR